LNDGLVLGVLRGDADNSPSTRRKTLDFLWLLNGAAPDSPGCVGHGRIAPGRRRDHCAEPLKRLFGAWMERSGARVRVPRPESGSPRALAVVRALRVKQPSRSSSTRSECFRCAVGSESPDSPPTDRRRSASPHPRIPSSPRITAARYPAAASSSGRRAALAHRTGTSPRTAPPRSSGSSSHPASARWARTRARRSRRPLSPARG